MFFPCFLARIFLWIEKSGAAGNGPCCLIRRCPQNGARDLESRQKPDEMCDFCLPAGRNSGCATSKVDKNRRECVIFVYRLVEIQVALTRK